MAKLYQFQKEGVRFIERKRGRGLIADEQGLGKTVQALTFLYRNLDAFPALVICPSSLKINWKREARKWLKCRVVVLKGKTPHDFPQQAVTIINYDILDAWKIHLIRRGFNTVVLDEAHKVKNSKALRTKAVKYVCKYSKNLVALTGTPIENRPIEIYNVVHMIKPSLFPNFWQFAQRYCGAKRTRFGWDFTGATHTKELHDILKQHVMIRRLKKDVLKDLPPKQVSVIPLPIDNRAEYSAAESDFIQYIGDKYEADVRKLAGTLSKEVELFKKMGIDLIDDAGIEKAKQSKIEAAAKAPVLAQIETLKQLAVKGKMNQMIDWFSNFLESGEKLVVFAHHKFVIETLTEKFGKIAVKLDGSCSQAQRQKAVDDFQNNPNIKLFFGNLEAAGVGITLTAASNAAICEYPWAPSTLQQAADRVHRITQTKQVTIYKFVGVNTIEEYIINLLDSKEQVIGQVLDGTSSSETTVLTELINIYKEKVINKIAL